MRALFWYISVLSINESTSLVYQCINESKSGCILSQFDIVMLGGRRVTVTWHHQNVSN